MSSTNEDLVDDYYKEVQLLLYVILLQNDKIFLHLSRDVSEDQIMVEASALFDFVKKNPPVRILETITIDNTFLIDYHVKKHMDCFGIDNVRGGSYSDEILPEYLVKALHHELLMNNVNLLDNDETVDLVNMSYMNIKWSPRFIADEKAKLECDLKSYIDLKQKIRSIQIHNDITIDRSIITDIEWLTTYLQHHMEQYIRAHPESATIKLDTEQTVNVESNDNNFVNEDEDEYDMELLRINQTINQDFKWINSYIQKPPEEKHTDFDFSKIDKTQLGHRYRCILRKLCAVHQCFDRLLKLTMDEDEYTAIKRRDYEPKIQFDRPDIVLDTFFYHLSSFCGEPNPNMEVIWKKEYPKAAHIISKFEYMTYNLINRIDEYVFELNQYPTNFEKRVRYALNYIELKGKNV